MSWLQVKVLTDEAGAAALEQIFEGLGALSVTMLDAADDPVLEPDLGTTPLWRNTQVVALFSADTSAEMVREQLERNQIAAADIECEVIEDRDWEREWMTHFHPMRFGSRLWICPSWGEPEDPNGVNLLLDPGLAFGTGTHPTTALCLTWLDSQQLQGKQVIDFGCGSGVLAIAALLLGADHATGTDIDPQALEASRDNAERNSVSEGLTLHFPEQMPEMQAEVVIANILANPLISLAPKLATLTLPGGSIALSGILKDQEEAVAEAYRNYFELDPTEYKEDWVLISGRRLPY
ncbi:ribosomal protein L11 methyltransferase [Hahella chejuensis KCTC 2396]|uniref:Ribosomal protein L11 methyltransferase n=1 Tax=Hahella chejuensis (strain KCTC 2396) TaxID=349521 RepID=PRMA_HAHCH|nr:50S ribosomal protein L11 methyltransferase [Hahella chejuensis]Q2S9L7.1 RecName: Full=Ribosomal protein L11 methyltransferase; Short=L11 Mtase [Hahella chejuensis KCTC 2396]ABC32657.1 ribosomal protein L11 methyltransferase [Hahella chejuensis KCTC 2396]